MARHEMLLLVVVVLLALCQHAAEAVRCYSSQVTVPGPSSQMVVVDCPSAQYCFKSYIERDTRGDRSYTETRACGNVGTCFEQGCTGPGDNRACCCAGDLCNGAGSLGGTLLMLAPLAAVLF